MSGGDAGMGAAALSVALLAKGKRGGCDRWLSGKLERALRKATMMSGKNTNSNVCIKMNNKHSCSKERTINHDVSS